MRCFCDILWKFLVLENFWDEKTSFLTAKPGEVDGAVSSSFEAIFGKEVVAPKKVDWPYRWTWDWRDWSVEKKELVSQW